MKKIPVIPKLWRGYFEGTNRGSAIARTRQRGEDLKCTAIIYDKEFGPSKATYIGKLTNAQAVLQLINYQGVAELNPVTGQLELDFDRDFQHAKGKWNTDIGTTGICELYAADFSLFGWGWSLLRLHLTLFFNRHGPLLYSSGLFTIALLGILGTFKLSYPALLLMLIPAPYVFKSYILELIHELRIKKLGPIELEQPLPDIRQVISAQVQEALYFGFLDGFLVPRTKLILLWLRENQPVSRQKFNAYATAIGVPRDNLDATWSALISTGCATLRDDRALVLTESGKRYIEYMLNKMRVVSRGI